MTANVLLVTKGHPFERNEFFSLFDALDINWTHVEHPAARVFFSPELAADYDAFVMYDMPGIRFRRGGPDYETPTESYKKNLLSLLESGKGMVFLHHAIAGWPAWEEYGEILGGRFFYLPGEVRDENVPDSGYHGDPSQSTGIEAASGEGWDHADGSNLVGWVKSYGNSPIAYFQGGHGPENYADENYRHLLQNAINWVASDEALQWARAEAG